MRREFSGNRRRFENQSCPLIGHFVLFRPMTLQEWERDVRNRQRNIVFPDTVLNEGRFYRNIASGNAIFTRGQRLSVLFMVAFFCFVNTGDLALQLSTRNRFDLWPVIGSFVWLLFWIFLAVKSLIPTPPPPRKYRRGYLQSHRRGARVTGVDGLSAKGENNSQKRGR